MRFEVKEGSAAIVTYVEGMTGPGIGEVHHFNRGDTMTVDFPEVTVQLRPDDICDHGGVTANCVHCQKVCERSCDCRIGIVSYKDGIKTYA